MNNLLLTELFLSQERFKLFVLHCRTENLSDVYQTLSNFKISVVNIGKEIAACIRSMHDYKYLSIDVYDYLQKLLDRHLSKPDNDGNDIVAIYNIGILLEPALELNVEQLLKEFSKSATLVIIWEHQVGDGGYLSWLHQRDDYNLKLSEGHLIKFNDAI